LTTFDKDTQVGLLSHRDCDRVAAASALFVPPTRLFLSPDDPEVYLNEDSFGLSEPVALAYHRQWESWYGELAHANYAFDLPDSESPLERLAQYRALVLPCCEFLSRSAQERLATYVRGGGILLIGPLLPHLDERMQPCDALAAVAANPGAGCVVSIPVEQKLANVLAVLGVVPPAASNDPSIELAVHRKGKRILVYARNATPEEHTAVLTLRERPGGVWQEVWPQHGTKAPTTMVRLAPYSVRIWEVLDA